MFRKENILMREALEQKTEYLSAVPCSATDPSKNMMLSLLATISPPIIYLLYPYLNQQLNFNKYFFL